MNKIDELEQRLKEYAQQSRRAEEVALEALRAYPERPQHLMPNDVLRREVFRHHTRTLLIDEIKEWIDELKGIRLYQLYRENDEGNSVPHGARQYMTEREAEDVNAAFEANRERLRWKPIDLFESEDAAE
ncbi:hypothetical protein U14_01540 [Candidatus Moduliflexus flocculans]|uniref:Uncharacterized protein n=1 Tax=Candidatus Moduliflexus flocculans TaxID=1499966 RepID=A0A0S6VSB0_9BACT|nr:hypothetical protein U14_01540 [Candidatus Moduliflexus flocculans]